MQLGCKSEDALPFPVFCWYEWAQAGYEFEEESTVLYVTNLIYNQYCVVLPSHACCHVTINWVTVTLLPVLAHDIDCTVLGYWFIIYSPRLRWICWCMKVRVFKPGYFLYRYLKKQKLNIFANLSWWSYRQRALICIHVYAKGGLGLYTEITKFTHLFPC